MDFGDHTPYVLAAYIVSFIAIGALIAARLRSLSNAREVEARADRRDEQTRPT